MFPQRLVGFVIASTFCCPSAADVKVRIRTTDDGQVSIKTIYVKGGQRRIDYETGVKRTARIADCDAGRGLVVDLDMGEYAVDSSPRIHSEREPEKRASKTERSAGRGLQQPLEWKTKDTGERQEFFGHLARHVVAEAVIPPRERTRAGPRREVVEIMTDGWYIDLVVPDGCSIPYERTTRSFGEQTRQNDESIGPRVQGFPIKQIHTVKLHVEGADGTSREIISTHEIEVVQLSEAILDPKVFEVPKGFKKVRRIELPH